MNQYLSSQSIHPVCRTVQSEVPSETQFFFFVLYSHARIKTLRVCLSHFLQKHFVDLVYVVARGIFAVCFASPRVVQKQFHLQKKLYNYVLIPLPSSFFIALSLHVTLVFKLYITFRLKGGGRNYTKDLKNTTKKNLCGLKISITTTPMMKQIGVYSAVFMLMCTKRIHNMQICKLIKAHPKKCVTTAKIARIYSFICISYFVHDAS